MSNSPDKANSSRRFSESDSFIVEHSSLTPNKKKRRVTKKELLTMSESRIPRVVKFNKETSDKFFRYNSRNELEGFYNRHLKDTNQQAINPSKLPEIPKDSRIKFTPKLKTSKSYKDNFKERKDHIYIANNRSSNIQSSAQEILSGIPHSTIKHTPDRAINTSSQTKSILNTSFTNLSTHNSSFQSTTSSNGRVHFQGEHSTPKSIKRRKLTSPPILGIPKDISSLGLGFVEKVLSKSQETIQPPDLEQTGSDTQAEKISSKSVTQNEPIRLSPREPFEQDISMFSPARDQSQLNLLDKTPDIFANDCDLSLDLINISAIKSPPPLDFDLFSNHGSVRSTKHSINNLSSSVKATPAKASVTHEPYPRHSTPPIGDKSKNTYTSPLLKYSTIKFSNGRSAIATPNNIQALVDASKSFEDFESYNNLDISVGGSFKDLEHHKGDAHIHEELELFDMVSVQSSDHHDEESATDQLVDSVHDKKPSDLVNMKPDLDKIQAQLVSTSQKVIQLESANKNLHSSLADKDKKIHQLEAKIQLLKSESETSKKQFQRTRSNEVAEKYLRESQLEIAQENRDRMRAQLQESQNKVAELVQENRNQDEYIKKSQQVVEELQGIVKNLQSSLSVSEKRFDLLKEHAEKKLKEASSYIQKRHETYLKNIEYYKELREKDKESIEALQIKLDESTKDNSELMEVSERILSYMEEGGSQHK